MFRFVWNLLKPSRCDNHEFEIVTRAREVYFNGAGVEIDYFKDTIATCIHCKYKRTLNTVRSNRVFEDGELIAVHRDPLGIYRGIKLAHKQ